MESKLERMSLNVPAKQNLSEAKSQSKKEIADSWDEEPLSESDTETESTNNVFSHSASGGDGSIPNAPPPTPISPNHHQGPDFRDWTSTSSNSLKTRQRPDVRDEDRRRPEKSTAVAGRMIAAGLGVNAPKKTEEQKKYDRAIKEQEIRRKNRERETDERERQDDDEAKQNVWDG